MNRRNGISNSATPATGRRNTKREDLPIFITAQKVNTLNNIKIDSVLAKILSDASCELRIVIGPDNQAVTTIVNEETGKRVGGIADLAKISGFRKFANDEKKRSTASEILYPVEEKVFRASQLIKRDDADFNLTRISPATITAIKESNNAVSILLNNKKLVESKVSDTDETIKQTAKVVLAWIEVGLKVNQEYILRLTKSEDTKGYLNNRLFELMCPKWVYEKMSRMKLAETENFDVRRILFPSDSKKGLAFTVKELASSDFRDGNSWILSNSGVQIAIFGTPASLRTILSTSEDVELDNEANVLGSQIRNEKVLIQAPWFGLEFLFENKARGKISSIAQRPDFTGPRQTIRTLSELFILVSQFEVETADRVAAVFERAMPDRNGVDFRNNISARRNLFRVVLDGAKVVGDQVKAVYVGNTPLGRTVWTEWVTVAGRFMPNSQILALIKTASGFVQDDATKNAIDRVIPDNLSAMVTGGSIVLTRPDLRDFEFIQQRVETAAEKELLVIQKQTTGILDKKDPKKGTRKNTPISALTRQSKRVVKMIAENDQCAFLQKPIEEWLGSFINDDLQSAAAKIVMAQFDSLLGEYEEDSEGSSDADSDEDKD